MLNIHPESQQNLGDGFENCFPFNFRTVYESISGISEYEWVILTLFMETRSPSSKFLHHRRVVS